jgi:ribosomal protein S28E/S33
MSLQNILLMGIVREVKSEIMINSTKARIIIIAILIPVIVALLLEFNLIWEVETDND